LSECQFMRLGKWSPPERTRIFIDTGSRTKNYYTPSGVEFSATLFALFYHVFQQKYNITPIIN
jgi:hypothetical protein